MWWPLLSIRLFRRLCSGNWLPGHRRGDLLQLLLPTKVTGDRALLPAREPPTTSPPHCPFAGRRRTKAASKRRDAGSRRRRSHPLQLQQPVPLPRHPRHPLTSATGATRFWGSACSLVFLLQIKCKSETLLLLWLPSLPHVLTCLRSTVVVHFTCLHCTHNTLDAHLLNSSRAAACRRVYRCCIIHDKSVGSLEIRISWGWWFWCTDGFVGQSRKLN